MLQDAGDLISCALNVKSQSTLHLCYWSPDRCGLARRPPQEQCSGQTSDSPNHCVGTRCIFLARLTSAHPKGGFSGRRLNLATGTGVTLIDGPIGMFDRSLDNSNGRK